MTRDSRYTPSLSEVDIGPEAEWLESLASLADGGLDAKRRNEILAQLDGDPEAMDLLAEVMALEAEVAEVSFPPDSAVTPDDGLRDNVIQGPWRKRAWAVATAIAAVLALVIVAPRLLSPLPPTPQSTVGALNVENLDGATLKNFPWSPDRGGGGGIGLSEDKLSSRDSFRLGVLATDFEIAHASGDRDGLRKLGYWFGQVLGDSSLSFVYSGRLDEPSQEALAEHSVAQMSILEYVDASYYRYGLWIRAAWLAAESGQLDFFRGESVRALGALHPPDQALEDEIVSLRQEIRGLGSESDLATLSARLESIAREHAN